MKQFLTALLLLLVFLSFAKEFGSKKDGWTLNLPDGWNTSAVLSSLVGKAIGTGEGSVETKLTAFKGTGLVNAVILNLITFETEASLSFNVKAVTDALEKDSGVQGKIQRKALRIGERNAVRIEYIRKPDHRMIQYFLMNGGRLWSLLFIGPEDMNGALAEEIRGIAETFRPVSAAAE